MSKSTSTAYLVLLLMLVCSVVALAFAVDVRVSDETGIRLDLPERVGSWQGRELVFCVQEDCRGMFFVDELADPHVCPQCGNPLSGMSYAEYIQLPRDTVIRKMMYVHPNGAVIHASYVLSGKERSSIHRPQVCLTNNGNEIVKTVKARVPLEGRDPLDVIVLDLVRSFKTPDGAQHASCAYYAYWFAAKNHETPYHLMRMFWMASDRVLRSTAHPWAYITVSGSRDPESDRHIDETRDFIRDFYPLITNRDS